MLRTIFIVMGSVIFLSNSYPVSALVVDQIVVCDEMKKIPRERLEKMPAGEKKREALRSLAKAESAAEKLNTNSIAANSEEADRKCAQTILKEMAPVFEKLQS